MNRFKMLLRNRTSFITQVQNHHIHTMFGTQMTSTLNANKDFEVPQAPDDTIQTLSWSSKANHLVSGSWDNQLRLWEVMKQQQYNDVMLAATPKLQTTSEGPVLSTVWYEVSAFQNLHFAVRSRLLLSFISPSSSS
jgi:WD40 repeat protein